MGSRERTGERDGDGQVTGKHHQPHQPLPYSLPGTLTPQSGIPPPHIGPHYPITSPPAIRSRKPSHGVSVSGFWPQPTPLPCVVKRRTTPLPLPHPHHLTTSPHHFPPPFPMARPKPSHRAQFCGFWPKPPPLPSYFQLAGHTTTNTTTAPPHRSFPPSPAAVLHGAPEVKPRQLGFGFLAQTPSPASRFANAQPHHHQHLIRTTPPHFPIILRHYS